MPMRSMSSRSLPALKAEFEKQRLLLAVLASNITPLVGVLFLEWQAAEVLLLYWVESLVVLLVTMVKMATVYDTRPALWQRLVAMAYIYGSNGLASVVQAVLILHLFAGEQAAERVINAGPEEIDFLGFIPTFSAILQEAFRYSPWLILSGTVGILIHQAQTFYDEYWKRGLYKTQSVHEVLTAPFKRYYPSNIALILSGVVIDHLVQAIGAHTVLVILLKLMLVALKIAIDVFLFRWSVRMRNTPQEALSEPIARAATHSKKK